jgi:TatD DNase family protein
MIDTHCHIDQYPIPETVVQSTELAGILTIAVTNLPSHYRFAVDNLHGNHYVRPALGFHPLACNKYAEELPIFLQLVKEADYIGEIGLDFSSAGVATRDQQLSSFRTILSALKDRRRFITVHSRGAEESVLECLVEANVGPVSFHWFSGSFTMLKRVVALGHYLSFTPAMTKAKKWIEWLSCLPRDRVLTETDGPFGKYSGEPAEPKDIKIIIRWIAQQWCCSFEEAENIVQINCERIFPAKAS